MLVWIWELIWTFHEQASKKILFSLFLSFISPFSSSWGMVSFSHSFIQIKHVNLGTSVYITQVTMWFLMNHNINNQTFIKTEQWFMLWITAMWQDSCTLHHSMLRSLSLFHGAESCQLPPLPPVRCANLGTKPGEQGPPCRVFSSHHESCEATYWGDAFAATPCFLCLCELLQMRTKRSACDSGKITVLMC